MFNPHKSAYSVNLSLKQVRLPWFRVHIILLNDPGRLISVHLMHTALVAGWAASMTIYELVLLDTTDPVYNPIWRQGCYVIPFATRLGANSSIFGWSIGVNSIDSSQVWTLETVGAAHILLSGSLVLAAFWHWAYWDLEIFISSKSGKLLLDLSRIFGIHLTLAAIACLGFGLGHLSGTLGPGMWTSDSVGLLGSVRPVKSVYSITGLTSYSFGVIPANHIVAGVAGILVGLWHITTRPGPSIYSISRLGDLEGVLSTSIASVFFQTFLVSGLMWYGSSTTPIELLGPSRYQWDNGLFSIEIERRVKSSESRTAKMKWEEIPDKIVLYDYIGGNPSKGGLFRSGPLLKGDGLVQNWVGHTRFELGSLDVYVRRMPAFFETFPVVLVDQGGTVRCDIPFRRSDSRYSVEQTNLVVYIAGGILNGVEYSKPSIVKLYCRKSQFGEVFTLDKLTARSDGVFRSSARGWYSFGHVTFACLFFLGHLWHAGRSIFKSLWTGLTLTANSIESIEYGRNEKLGDFA